MKEGYAIFVTVVMHYIYIICSTILFTHNSYCAGYAISVCSVLSVELKENIPYLSPVGDVYMEPSHKPNKWHSKQNYVGTAWTWWSHKIWKKTTVNIFR